MFFGNNNDRDRFDFPKGKGPFEKVLAFLGDPGQRRHAVRRRAHRGPGEGQHVLRRGRQGQGGHRVRHGRHGAPEPTSGSTGFNAERERVGVRVYSVYIGGAYDYYGEGANTLLSRFSDAVITVKDLNPESAQKIFASI
jgi:hypothetical protein